MKSVVVAVCLSCALAVPALGDVPAKDKAPAVDHPPARAETLISADGEAQTSIANDLLTLQLVVEREAVDAARLHQDMQKEVARALAEARKSPAVQVKSSGFGIYPVYDKGKIIRHRASHTLILDTGDFAAGLTLAGSLQPFLVRSLTFSVSPERRKASEKVLLEQAVADFQERVGIAARSLGQSEWRVTQLNIGAHQLQPRRVILGMEMAMSASRAAPVEAESGESQLQVSVSGIALAQ